MASTNASTEGLLDHFRDDKSCELLGPTALASIFLYSLVLLQVLIIRVTAGCSSDHGSCGDPFLDVQETQRSTYTTLEDLVCQLCF
jgi:hypothetical protein